MPHKSSHVRGASLKSLANKNLVKPKAIAELTVWNSLEQFRKNI